MRRSSDITPDRREDEPLLRTLAGWDAARVETLLRLRPDLASPPPSGLAALAARATSPQSLTNALLLLDRGAWQVLEAACILGPDVTPGRLAALLGTAPEAIAAAVARLCERALLLEFRDGWSVPVGLASHPALRNPARLGAPAAVHLGSATVGELQKIAQRLGVGSGDARKSAIVARINAAIADSAHVARILGTAPNTARVELERANEFGPRVPIPYPYSLEDRSPVGWLVNRALLVRADWYTAEVPREVGLALRGGTPFPDFSPTGPLLETQPVDDAWIDGEANAAALRIVADVGTLLDEWDARAPKLLKDGGVGIRDVRRIAQALARPERDAAVVIDLTARAGLIGAAGDPPSGLPTADADDWRALSVAMRWCWLVDAWLRTPAHPSLAGATGTNDKPIPPMLELSPHPNAIVRRRVVLAALAVADEGRSATLASLRSVARWVKPFVWEGGPALPDMLVDWAVRETSLLGLGAGGALGAVGRLVADERLDDAADALAEHAPVLTRTIVIQGDLTAIGAGELDAHVRAQLELLADVESKGAATVYRFSEASVRRAFDAGLTAPQIEEFLDAHAPKGVPQALRYLITDVGRRHGSLRVGEAASYLRCDDPTLLAEACRSRKLASLGLRTLAPTVAVSTAPAARIVEALRSAGYLPAEEDGAGAMLTAGARPRRAARRLLPHLAGNAGPGDTDMAEVARRLIDIGIGPTPDLRSVAKRQPPVAQPALVAFSAGDAIEWDEFADGFDTDGFDTDGLDSDEFGLDELEGPLEDFTPAAERPMAITRATVDIVALLEQAETEEWCVRLSYENSKGQESQLTAAIMDVSAKQAVVEVLPSWAERTLVLSRIRWARVLTEAEEEAI